MILGCYVFYLLVGICVIVTVGQILHHNGRVFIIDCLDGNEKASDAVNHLLLAAYYLLNIALVVLNLSSRQPVDSFLSAVELCSAKIGIVLLTLGLMHFFNMLVLGTIKLRRCQAQSTK